MFNLFPGQGLGKSMSSALLAQGLGFWYKVIVIVIPEVRLNSWINRSIDIFSLGNKQIDISSETNRLIIIGSYTGADEVTEKLRYDGKQPIVKIR